MGQRKETKIQRAKKQIIMNKKIKNLKEFEIWSDLNFLTTIVQKQINKRSTENLEKMSESLIRLFFYFHEYSNDKQLYEKALSEYKLSKNRAIERARKAEQENERLRKQNESISL